MDYLATIACCLEYRQLHEYFNIKWKHSIQNVVVYTGDPLLTRTREEVHLNTFDEVFRCLEKVGLNVGLKKSKCHFMLPSTIFLGNRIDTQGLHPLTEKMKTIQDAPKP